MSSPAPQSQPKSQPRSHRFVAPEGVGLAVHDWGGDGDPVLLAHATGFHGRIWAPIADRLVESGRKVWSFDFRGQGDSDPSPDGTYSWDEFAADARAVAAHVEVAGDPKLLTCGHSKGGAALLRGELDAPGTYARIWTYEPIMVPDEARLLEAGENPLSIGARRRRPVWPSRDAVFESYGSRPPLNAFDADSLHAYVDYGFRDLPDGTIELKCAPEVEATIFSMSAKNGVFPRLPEVQCPVLVAAGEASVAIVPKLAERIADRLPRGEVEVWTGHGHFGPQADPDRAVESMLAFASRTG